jgi:hypothetical protein
MSENLDRQLLATNEGGDFEPLEPGVYNAMVSKIINYGVIPRSSQNFPDMKPGPMFRIEWVTDGETPAYIGKDYLLSTNEKSTFLKDLRTWTEKSIPSDQPFNVYKLFGQFAKLQVGMTSTGKNNKVLAVLKAVKKFETDAESFIYDVNEHDQELFDKLPEFIQETIKTSDTWKDKYQTPKEIVNPANPTAQQVEEAAKKVGVDDLFD